MIDEELTLKDLRKAHEMTQEKLAAVLGMKQASVSDLEKRSDMLLSTLREYVEALGGELEIRATFPGKTVSHHQDVFGGWLRRALTSLGGSSADSLRPNSP